MKKVKLLEGKLVWSEKDYGKLLLWKSIKIWRNGQVLDKETNFEWKHELHIFKWSKKWITCYNGCMPFQLLLDAWYMFWRWIPVWYLHWKIFTKWLVENNILLYKEKPWLLAILATWSSIWPWLDLCHMFFARYLCECCCMTRAHPLEWKPKGSHFKLVAVNWPAVISYHDKWQFTWCRFQCLVLWEIK